MESAAADTVLKKHPLTRAVHYLFLLPFLPALRPLLVSYRLQDLVIYLCGVVLVVLLIIYGNRQPLVIIEADRLALFLHYRHSAEHHRFSEISEYKRVSSSRVTLYSREHKPVTLHLTRNDAAILIGKLEEKKINAQ